VSDRLEDRLRRLPGVLDCSVLAGGVALLVHPEVDVRVLKAKAQAVFAELGDERPLVIMGGLASEPARRGGWLAVVGRGEPTPASLSVFVVLVLCLLALVPLTPPSQPAPLASPVSRPVTGVFGGVLASSITPDLARPVRSWQGRGAVRALSSPVAAPVVVPVPAAVAGPPRAGGASASALGRGAAHSNAIHGAGGAPRPVARALTTAVSLLPAVTIERAVAGSPGWPGGAGGPGGPGNSGAHRRLPKP
jgi:hypothetical protein